MKVLVTGGGGFLGRAIVQRLRERGDGLHHRVIELRRIHAFDEAAFDAALREFARRDRRFGRVSGTTVPAGFSRAE